MNYLTLNNDFKIPSIATGPGSAVGWDNVSYFGNSFLGNKLNQCSQRLRNKCRRHAWVSNLTLQFKLGYRLIDHSIAYGDEDLILQALQKAELSRDEVVICTRFSNANQYERDLYQSFQRVQRKLGGGPIDLFGFHWPVPEHYLETYRFLEKLYKDGEIRAIALCNCQAHHLERIMQECDIVPTINQIEIHPLFSQKALIDYCQHHHITVQAYTPLARNDERLRKVRSITDIAKKYGKSMSQIILRWHVQQGIIPIPRSTNYTRLKQNISIFDFELTPVEMRGIDDANINSRLRYDPDNCDYTQL